MENEFLLQNLAAKISNIIQYPIPLNPPECDTVTDNCARLYCDGIKNNSTDLQKYYDFKFRFFAGDHKTTEYISGKVTDALRRSQPEIFSDGHNKFHIRYCNINSVSSGITDISGIVYFFTELKFSVVV